VDGSSKREFCLQHERDGMVHVTTSRGRGLGGGSAAGNEVPGPHAGPSQKRRERISSSPVRSRGADKRARRAPTDMPVAPIQGEPALGEGLIAADCGSLSESACAVRRVKMEPAAFSIGRRGGWMR